MTGKCGDHTMKPTLRVIGLVLCIACIGCGKGPSAEGPRAGSTSDRPPIEDSRASSTLDRPPIVESRGSDPLPLLGDEPILVLSAKPSLASVGEEIEVRQFLFHPPSWECVTLSIRHSLHATLIPTEKEAAEVWHAQGKRTSISPTRFSGAVKMEDAGALQYVDASHKMGWPAGHGSSGSVTRTIVPGLSSRTNLVRFDKPATYLLGSEWHTRLNGKEARYRAYLLIEVVEDKNTGSD